MKSQKAVIVLMTKKEVPEDSRDKERNDKVSTRTEGNTSVKSNESERDVSNYELVMTKNVELKKKVEDLEKQNTKYKEEIEFFEKCKAKSKKIMEKYMKEKKLNEPYQIKEAHEATEKVKKHVTFGGTEFWLNEQSEEGNSSKRMDGENGESLQINTEYCNEDVQNLNEVEVSQKEDSHDVPDTEDLHKEEVNEESTKEISDSNGNISLVTICGIPELETCNLNAKVCLQKVENRIEKDKSKSKKKGRPNCIICRRRFDNKHALKKHISDEHRRREQYDCPHCYKQLKSRKSLNEHLDKNHYDRKSYGKELPCSTCSLKFMTTD